MNIITLKDALEQGLKRYYTGRACKNGHIAQRQTSSAACIECLKSYAGNRRKELHRNAMLTNCGFITVGIKIKPEDKSLVEHFSSLLNQFYVNSHSPNYIKQLTDYAEALYKASILFVDNK